MGPTPPPPGPFPPGAPAPRPAGIGLGAFLGLLFGVGALVLGVALVVMTLLFVRERRAREAAAFEAMSRPAASSPAHPETSDTRAELPTVTRHVPNHSLRVLEGCSDDNLGTIAGALAEAIDNGAPQYNEGHFVDCYSTYVGAAEELERKLPRACGGPTRALADGRQKARALARPSEQAWAMRDAFDGLLDVIGRSQEGGGTAL